MSLCYGAKPKLWATYKKQRVADDSVSDDDESFSLFNENYFCETTVPYFSES